MFLLEVVQELFERQFALDLESVPESPLFVVIFQFRRGNRLGEAKERQCQIDEAIFVERNVLDALGEFDELETYEASDDRCRCRDRGNDFASDEFTLVPIGQGDAVVGGTQIRGCDDKVYVEVGVVIFFELLRMDDEAVEFVNFGQFFDELGQAFVINVSTSVGCLNLRADGKNLD